MVLPRRPSLRSAGHGTRRAVLISAGVARWAPVPMGDRGHLSCDFQAGDLAPTLSDDLHANWQALTRQSDGDRHDGMAGQIEEDAVKEVRLQLRHRFAVHINRGIRTAVREGRVGKTGQIQASQEPRNVSS